MVPMLSTDIDQQFTPEQRQQLLALAQLSVESSVAGNPELQIQLGDYSPELCALRACFVTLSMAGRLRGCIGALEAYQTLVQNVVYNARAAALFDSRFAPVNSAELTRLSYSISVLSLPSPVPLSCEDELYTHLVPGKHGIIFEAGSHRSTYLPSVWEQLPEPKEFIKQLKLKAGLSSDFWSDAVKISLYTTESFSTE